jgi:hypothetical protein
VLAWCIVVARAGPAVGGSMDCSFASPFFLLVSRDEVRGWSTASGENKMLLCFEYSYCSDR